MKSGLLYVGNDRLHNKIFTEMDQNDEIICFDISGEAKNEKMISIVMDKNLRELCEDNVFLQISLAVAYAEAYSCDRLSLPYDNEIIKGETNKISKYISSLKKLVSIGTMNNLELVFAAVSDCEDECEIEERRGCDDNRYLVLFSGGIDCTVAVAMLKNRNKDVYLINFEYGQRNSEEEAICLSKTSEQFNLDYVKVDIRDFYDHIKFSSGLLNENIELNLGNKELEYVPFRNTIFFTIALLYCIKMHISNITSGSQRDDMISPDNSPEYYEVLKNFIEYSKKYSNIKIEPILKEVGGKSDIIALGTKLNVDFRYCWTCHCAGIYYDNVAHQCGICSDCRTRYRAFASLGIKDPIQYHVLPRI